MADDPLRERDRLAVRANTLATRSDDNVEFHAATTIEAIESAGQDKGFKVTARKAGQTVVWNVDRIVANVGYTPDTNIYRELQIHECYASLGPMKLAAALGAESGDCLKIESGGPEVLRNPEPNFYIFAYHRQTESGPLQEFQTVTLALPLAPETPAPAVALSHLDELWFQVGGTLCNLECRHCFISCSPHNHTFGFLDLATVQKCLEQSVELGVKEYYFTGGEPFLNRDMVPILEATLRYGAATVLTNGTVLQPDWLQRLRAAAHDSLYSLEFRVSIDGFTAADNDPVRGRGTFERILRGIRLLVQHDFLPIITVTRTHDEQDDASLLNGFVRLLQEQGYQRPRLKILPTLRIGAEVQRQRGYQCHERVTPAMMDGYDTGLLLCSHSRIVTDRGVYVCPILVDAPDARLGAALPEAMRPFGLRHQACYTCYQHGALCANPSGGARDA
jgi:sulfatase maturation enzyme AslB (radical SAM superfamily)